MKPSLVILPLMVLLSFNSRISAKDSDAQKVLPVSIGLTNSGTISLPGQQDRFTFSGTNGQRFYYDALDLDYENISVQLLSPSGVYSLGFSHGSDTGPLYLDETGPYTIVIDGYGDVVGDYSFCLLDAANATPISYGTTNTGQLTSQNLTAIYSFTGINGQHVALTNISVSAFVASWRLVAPNDETLLYGNIDSNLGEAVLPANGTYLVLVEGSVEEATPLDF